MNIQVAEFDTKEEKKEMMRENDLNSNFLSRKRIRYKVIHNIFNYYIFIENKKESKRKRT